jgi:nucleoside phosphorylase
MSDDNRIGQHSNTLKTMGALRVPFIPVYLSHSYRPEDRDVNDHFWKILHTAGFSITVDPGTTSFFPTALEIMMARSVGYAAVVTFREEEENYLCSPFIMHEYGLAVQAQRPRLILRDKRVPLRNFGAQGTLEVEFEMADLDRSTERLEQQLKQFRIQASGRLVGHRYRRENVGIAIHDKHDSEYAGITGRRVEVERFLDKQGWEPLDLAAIAEDPGQLAKAADQCDFVIVDVDNGQMAGIADFLLGRGTPLLKVARRSADQIMPQRLLGSAALLRAAAADQLVMYYSDKEEFESKIQQQISRAMTDRDEFTDFPTGHRYFRSLGREAQPVFVSNAAAMNGLARDLADSLNLESIPFFHYRYHNTIGLGERWNLQLERLIASSGIFLPLIDGSYWESPYCMQEYEAAVRLADAGRIMIIPYLLDGFDKGPTVNYQGENLCGESPQSQVSRIVSKLDNVLAAKPKSNATSLTEPLEAGRSTVDVAIITILEEEYKAVLHLLKRVRQVVGSSDLDNQHAWVVGEVDTPTNLVPYTVALAMSPGAGTNAAVIATKNTILAFDPRCILVVGVAGGLGSIKLGDVVVADRICAYEYGKVDHGFQPRPDLDSPTDAAITSAARTLAARYPGWYAELTQLQGVRDLSPDIIVGNVASGDKVVDDTTDSFFANVLKSRKRLQAVEMEGAGAAAAIQDAREMRQAVSFGMIRGISDLPRERGSQPGSESHSSEQTEIRDSWKELAASAAAVAAIQLIRLSWPRPPRAGR